MNTGYSIRVVGVFLVGLGSLGNILMVLYSVKTKTNKLYEFMQNSIMYIIIIVAGGFVYLFGDSYLLSREIIYLVGFSYSTLTI